MTLPTLIAFNICLQLDHKTLLAYLKTCHRLWKLKDTIAQHSLKTFGISNTIENPWSYYIHRLSIIQNEPLFLAQRHPAVQNNLLIAFRREGHQPYHHCSFYLADYQIQRPDNEFRLIEYLKFVVYDRMGGQETFEIKYGYYRDSGENANEFKETKLQIWHNGHRVLLYITTDAYSLTASDADYMLTLARKMNVERDSLYELLFYDCEGFIQWKECGNYQTALQNPLLKVEHECRIF